ncbi:MAG: CoA-binding protein [Bacteroidales bacterium]
MLHVVLGASPNPRRYSYKATELLGANGYNVYPVGIRSGKIGEYEIIHEFPENQEIHTITMYLSPENQEQYYEKIYKNLPRKVIFNPGTYNPEFQQKLNQKGVITVNDCTLIMVNQGRY